MVTDKKVQRLWVAEGLHAAGRCRRKRTGVSTAPVVVAQEASDVWSVDFQFDSNVTGKALAILSTVDGRIMKCLGDLIDF